jgi:hypothetical protein
MFSVQARHRHTPTCNCDGPSVVSPRAPRYPAGAHVLTLKRTLQPPNARTHARTHATSTSTTTASARPRNNAAAGVAVVKDGDLAVQAQGYLDTPAVIKVRPCAWPACCAGCGARHVFAACCRRRPRGAVCLGAAAERYRPHRGLAPHMTRHDAFWLKYGVRPCSRAACCSRENDHGHGPCADPHFVWCTHQGPPDVASRCINSDGLVTPSLCDGGYWDVPTWCAFSAAAPYG